MSNDATTTPYGATPYPSPYPGAPDGAAPVQAWQPAPPPRELAGWWSRVGASVLDQLVVGVPYFAGGMIGLLLSTPGVDQLGEPSRSFTAAGMVAVWLGLLTSIVLGIWNRFLRQGRTGQSLGKKALGIRLVGSRTGAPIGAGAAFGRDVAHLLDGVLYLGYLWPLWDRDKQTFADKLLSSVVVRAR
ncbi:RDD family protein [Cellulomonas aerilata]|uniref:RDD domain-containing protein n=1 Tax=Cellulomonas aerilata TaxID=515326 RepID=A0A512DFC8_9CELL|nr:RDD family protein [Cellulomonas aerilata]GEO34930.1 hypothetical protein CAE01nite_26550 [Cellulomonas aerilata]